VALCSAPSRTRRAAFGGAASGILDRACAQRSGVRQVGTEGWSHLIEQRDGCFLCLGGHLLAGVFGIERGLPGEHGAGDRGPGAVQLFYVPNVVWSPFTNTAVGSGAFTFTMQQSQFWTKVNSATQQARRRVFIAFLAYCLHVTLARRLRAWRRG
jgi:hypothetical protein